MKPTLIFASMISLILISNCGTKSNNGNKETSATAVQKPDSVETPKKYRSGDTTVYQNAYFEIKAFPSPDNIGELFKVINRKSGKSFMVVQEASNYVGMVDNYLILDSGTAPTNRGLDVYDLNGNEVVLSTFHEELKIEGRMILFNTKVEIADESKRPKCNPSDSFEVGYVEAQTFDLTTLQLVKSGKFECAYFQ